MEHTEGFEANLYGFENYVESNMYLTIYEGIDKRRLLEVYYDGYYRVVEPHLYGNNADGKDILYGYQLAGSDGSESHRGWKTFYVPKIESVKMMSTTFAGRRPTFDPKRRKMLRVYRSL